MGLVRTMATVETVLRVARGELGTKESPANSNRVKYNTWYYGREVMGSGYPWCMVFCQWVFDQAGVKLPRRTASCGELMNAAKAAGCWVATGFRPGDVAIYDFSGHRKTTQHCGIVEMELPDYGVQAIEGNTSQGGGSQDNGGMVCRKTRADKYIIGAVRSVFDPEKEEDAMTGKEIYEALNAHLKTQPAPPWAEKELAEAVALGITDGKEPMALIPRYQAAIMAKRAAEGK